MGQALGGLRRRHGRIAAGRIRGPCPCLREVVGELCRRDHAAGVALSLEGPADPQVEAGADLAAEPFHDRLAKQVVGEAVRPKRPGRAGQDVRPGGLAE